jgi:hemerythrin superfamily protein
MEGRNVDATDDVIELLTQQHRRVEDLLKALLDDAPASGRAKKLVRAGDDLAVHILAEEAVFYPAVRAVRTEDVLLESLEEHLSLKRLLADLLDLSPDDETFVAKCKVLSEQAEHHHGEEEQHLFPKVALLLDEARRAELGREFRRHEQRLCDGGTPRMLVKRETDAAEPLPDAPGAPDPAGEPGRRRRSS